MRQRTRGLLGALAVLAVAAAAGTAQPPPPGEHGPRVGRAGHMARFLGLTDEQQAEVRKVMEERRADHEALHEKLQENREAMRQALESANADPTAVGELAIEGHRLRQQKRALRDAQEQAVRELLTAEQKVKFDAMTALRGDEMGAPPEEGRGPRHERGHGRP